MVRYFLLRDNEETGPYTLTELKGKRLYTTDLVWIEGESKCWKVPNEIEGLKGIQLITKESIPKAKNKRFPQNNSYAIPVYGSASLSQPNNPTSIDFLAREDYTPPSFEALKEKYAQKPPQKRVWQRQVNIGSNIMGLLTLLIGLGLSAYMVKKAVQNIDFEPAVASAQAHEIGIETMQQSTTNHAAFATMSSIPETANLVPDTGSAASRTVQTVVTKETDAQPQLGETKGDVQSTTRQVGQGKNEETSQTHTMRDPTAQQLESEAFLNAVEVEKETVPEKNGEEEKPAGKSSLRLAANQFNVGFLGGISNLEISVTNPSAKAIGKAVVEVEYLRPNGKVVGSQTVTVTGIAPGSSKTIPVPDNGRGVSVRYKVVKTEE